MHTIRATLIRQTGGQGYHYFPVPANVTEALRAAGHKRVLMTLDGKEYRRALIAMKEADGYVVMLGLDIMRAHRLEEGSTVLATITQDPNPDDLNIPEELEVWLEQDEDAARIWNGYTPGLQRSLCYYINSAKRAETKFKRTEELVHKIKTGQLYSQRKSKT
jgi:hypothetical protein